MLRIKTAVNQLTTCSGTRINVVVYAVSDELATWDINLVLIRVNVNLMRKKF